MSGARKLLIFGGVTLAAFGMLYGLHYAVFIEHQTLDRLGGSLATAFLQAASRNISASQEAVDAYGHVKYAYVRQVDAHSHWIGLAMLLIVLGAVFDRVRFAERVRFWLAVALLAGSVIFPLGVMLQAAKPGGVIFSAMAIGGAGLVTAALAGVAAGFARRSS